MSGKLSGANYNDLDLFGKYTLEHVKPDALEYVKYFYAKNHIPGIQNRPGNNTYPVTNVYKNYLDNYNLQCYNKS